jgi:hypothetical protein
MPKVSNFLYFELTSGMKRIVLFILLCFSVIVALGNARFPFYETGGVSDLRVFFPNDSIYFSKIQLEKKTSNIVLFPGYSVVKNDYYFRNISDSTISIFLGFPFSMSALSDQFGAVHIDSAVVLEVYHNEQLSVLKKCESPVEVSRQSHGWNVWENEFKPQTITHIQVLAIVTTRSKLTTNDWENYDNSLALLNHFSNKWNGPIAEMTIRVNLGDGVEISDLIGVTPSLFKTDGKRFLIWRSKNIEPSNKENVIFRYSNKTDQEAISQLIANKKTLFDKATKLDSLMEDDSQWSMVQANNFGYLKSESTGSTILYIVIGIGAIIMIVAPILIIKKFKGVKLPQ